MAKTSKTASKKTGARKMTPAPKPTGKGKTKRVPTGQEIAEKALTLTEFADTPLAQKNAASWPKTRVKRKTRADKGSKVNQINTLVPQAQPVEIDWQGQHAQVDADEEAHQRDLQIAAGRTNGEAWIAQAEAASLLTDELEPDDTPVAPRPDLDQGEDERLLVITLTLPEVAEKMGFTIPAPSQGVAEQLANDLYVFDKVKAGWGCSDFQAWVNLARLAGWSKERAEFIKKKIMEMDPRRYKRGVKVLWGDNGQEPSPEVADYSKTGPIPPMMEHQTYKAKAAAIPGYAESVAASAAADDKAPDQGPQAADPALAHQTPPQATSATVPGTARRRAPNGYFVSLVGGKHSVILDGVTLFQDPDRETAVNWAYDHKAGKVQPEKA